MSETDPPFLDREVGGFAFGLDASGYHQARLAYPEELYDELFRQLPLRPSILEIGAGSGLVTQSLLKRNPSRLTAVEPDPALVAFTQRRLSDPRLRMIEAAFPEARINDRFDLIACAAAFHWMDPQATLARAKSLLAPAGFWAMWWHSYLNPGRGDKLADLVTPLLQNIAQPPFDTLLRQASLDEQHHRDMLIRGGFQAIEYRLFCQERQLTTQQVISLYRSYSYVRALPADKKGRLLEDIATLVDKNFDGLAPNLVLTPLYFASR